MRAARAQWLWIVCLAACGSGGAASPDDGSIASDGGGGGTHDLAAALDANAPADLAAMSVLYPLVVGHQWTFASQVLGSGAACGSTMTQTVSSANAAAGRAAFQVTTLCPPPTQLSVDNYSVPTAGGDEVDFDNNGTWVVIMDPMEVDGHSWPSFPGYTLTWQRVSGSVTVPAGTFADCWTARSSQQTNAYVTYCRGVGPVVNHFDLNGNGAEWKLTAKNF